MLFVIHASPPCQHYSPVTTRGGNRDDWPDLIEPVRERLKALGCPYVIENVMSAPLDKKRSIVLCADNMGLRTVRHRRFEYSDGLTMVSPPHNKHKAKTATSHRREMWDKGWNISITGDGPGTYVGPDAMGIDWMTGNELCEAIPPAYTEYVGKMILSQVETDGTRPLLLDLFCGAGGASMGYYRAGFDVIGVDIKPMPRYPFTFIQADAMELLDWLRLGGTTNDARSDFVVGWGYRLKSFAAVHASPPCQAYSTGTNNTRKHGKIYPHLIEPVRERLADLGMPYVVENVPQAPLVEPVTLCGSQFGLRAELPGYGPVGLRRHRCFESNWLLPDAGAHDHSLRSVTVTGHGSTSGNRKTLGMDVPIAVCREIMGIDWMNRNQLGESIPPAYTEYVGGHLMQYISTRSDACLAA
jgi:DNA (cytosine-5)-methyltransferase 1